MPSRNTIEIVVQGEDKASKVIGQVNTSLDTLGKFALGAVVGGVTAATAAVAGFAGKALAEFATFQQGMAEVFTLLPDISQEAMDDLENQIQYISARFGKLPNEVIPAVYQAISAGVPPDNIFQFMETATKASIAGVTNLETAVDGITSVVNAYGAEVISAAQASDIMFTAVKLGKTDFGQLSAALFNVIPTAASLGVGFEDIAAGLAAITAQGTPTSVATTQMRQLLVELQKPTTEVSKLFQEMAGKSFPDFIAEGGNLAAALGLIEQGAQASGKDLASVFGSVEALNAFLGLTGSNMERYAGFLEQMGASAGATDKAFQTMSKTIQFQVNRLQAKLSNMFINVGRKIEPFAAKIIEAVGDAVSVFDAFLSDDLTEFSTGDFGAFGNAIRDMLVTIKPVFDTLTHLVSSFFAAFEAGIPFVDNVRVHINAFLAEFAPNLLEPVNQFIDTVSMIGQEIGKVLEPITKWVSENVKLSDVLTVIGIAIASVVLPAIASLIAAIVSFAAPIVALIGAVALLRTAWENDFGGIRTFITNEVLPALQQLAEWFLTTALPAIVNFIQTQAIPFFEQITTTIGQIWTLVQPGLQRLADWFTGTALPGIVAFIRDNVIPLITEWINLIAGIWTMVGTALGQFLEWFIVTGLPIAIEWIEKAKEGFDNLVGVIGALWQLAQPHLENFKNGIKTVFDFIKNNIIQPVINAINSIPETVNRIAGEVQRVLGEIGNAISSINLNPFDPGGLFNPTGYANGMDYIDRDRIVKVHRGEAILTADENEARINGGNTTNNININLTGNYRNQADANQDADMLLAALRSKGLDLSRA